MALAALGQALAVEKISCRVSVWTLQHGAVMLPSYYHEVRMNHVLTRNVALNAHALVAPSGLSLSAIDKKA